MDVTLTKYPGQCYDKDKQCQFIYGNNSRYCNGVSKKFVKTLLV